MPPSRHRLVIGPVDGTERQDGQHLTTPMNLEVAEGREPNSAVLAANVEYPARGERTIEIPLSSTDLRRLHDATGALLNDSARDTTGDGY